LQTKNLDRRLGLADEIGNNTGENVEAPIIGVEQISWKENGEKKITNDRGEELVKILQTEILRNLIP
jgi:hypothetical protein